MGVANNLIAEFAKIIGKRVSGREFLEIAAFEIRQTDKSGLAERVQFRRLLHFAAFNEAKPFPHNFTGVLITPAFNQGLNHRLMAFG